jgi:peptide/nickel transport system permease protein
VQFWEYLKGIVLHFDFGFSYENDTAVRDLLFDRLPATFSLALGAAVVWLAVGLMVGVISAVRRGTLLDRAAMGAALLAVSAPGTG